MKLKTFISAITLLAAFTSAGPVTIGPVGPAALQAGQHGSDIVVVYQFHRRFRCEECYKLEEAIKETLGKHFSREIEEETLVIKVVDLDAEGNDQYGKRYDFFYNTVIVAQLRGDQDVRFKNIDKVWSLANDKEKLMEFIRTEVSEYVNGPDSK